MALSLLKLDVKYFVSPHVLPLPAGIVMIIGGLAGGIHTDWVSLDLPGPNGVALALIGTILTFYSLWLARKFMHTTECLLEDPDQRAIRLLRVRATLSHNMIRILSCIEAVHPNRIKRSDLEACCNLNGKNLSLRLSNLELRGFIVSEQLGDSYVFSLAPFYVEVMNYPSDRNNRESV